MGHFLWPIFGGFLSGGEFGQFVWDLHDLYIVDGGRKPVDCLVKVAMLGGDRRISEA